MAKAKTKAKTKSKPKGKSKAKPDAETAVASAFTAKAPPSQGVSCPIHGQQKRIVIESTMGGMLGDWTKKYCMRCVSEIMDEQVSGLMWRHQQKNGAGN